MPVRLEFAGGNVHHLTLAEGEQLYVELGGVIMQAEPADTERPGLDAITRKSTPAAIAAVREPIKTTCPKCGRAANYTARSPSEICEDAFHVRRSSSSLRAVSLPEPGHDQRVADELAKGKNPMPKK
jgi:hypothetical protein